MGLHGKSLLLHTSAQQVHFACFMISHKSCFLLALCNLSKCMCESTNGNLSELLLLNNSSYLALHISYIYGRPTSLGFSSTIFGSSKIEESAVYINSFFAVPNSSSTCSSVGNIADLVKLLQYYPQSCLQHLHQVLWLYFTMGITFRNFSFFRNWSYINLWHFFFANMAEQCAD